MVISRPDWTVLTEMEDEDCPGDRRTKTQMLSARQKETFAFLLLRATQSQVSIYAGFSPTSLFNIPTLVCAVTHTQRSAWACVCEQWHRRTVGFSSDLNWTNFLSVLGVFVFLQPPAVSSTFTKLHTHRRTPSRTRLHANKHTHRHMQYCAEVLNHL